MTNSISYAIIIIVEREVRKMTVEELRIKRARRKEWLGDEITDRARNKLFMGEALTSFESQKLFNYLRKLENTIDKILDE